MPDITFADLDNKKVDLIRKALQGAVLLGQPGTAMPSSLTVDSTTTPGTPVLNSVIQTDFKDLGEISDAGAVFSDAVSTNDITSWGRLEPSRRDISSDVTTLHVVAQETNLMTLTSYYGLTSDAITPNATTGEVAVRKPSTAAVTYYPMIVIGVDGNEDNEIYCAAFLPRVGLSDRGDKTLASGADGIYQDSTWTAFTDTTAGYSLEWHYGGPGWKALLTEMGFGA